MYDEKEDLGRRLGKRLEVSRRERGLTLEEAQGRTSIWAHHLEALERGDLDALPNPAWARGITVTYANSLGLEGEALAEAYFPGSLPSRPKRRRARLPGWGVAAPLRRHRKEAVAATLGAIAATVIVFATAILFPYNGVTGGLNDFLHRIAPGTFLASAPQRVAVLADAQVGASGEGNVITVKVADDGLGVLSIPRNTLVEIPDHEKGAVGDALALGGPDLARRTVVRLTGVDVPHYFAISAEGMKEVVDKMGGVRIDVPNPVSGRAASGGSELALRPGPQTLDGDQALVYLQGADLPSDAERAKRQQAFLSTMLGQALGPRNLLSDPATLDVVLENAQTNISPPEAIQLARHVGALKNSGGAIEARVVPGREAAAAGTALGDRPGGYWVPDGRRLPDALGDTLR